VSMAYPQDGSTTQIRLGPEDVPFPVGRINFIAQGNPGDLAKFCVVPKEFPAGDFVQQFFQNACGLARPKVLISVTGGAQDFTMLSSKLEQIFSRGLLRAAQNTTAWIVTGGLDSGVMKFVGDAVRDQDADVPCIGIATYSKVINKELLMSGATVSYTPEKPNDAVSAALNPNHTHFVLVDSKVDNWGEEITFRTALEDFISREWRVPMVLVAVNGGPGTVQTVVDGVKQKFPTIIVEGSGRASDAIACYLKHKADPARNSLEEWNKFLGGVKPAQHPQYVANMEVLHTNRKYVTIFNPNENATEDMDKAILRSILTIHADSGFKQKLSLGVQWGRADLIEELLQQDDSTMAAQEKVNALNSALQKSLKLNQPEIYELLVSKGADKSTINLYKLYSQPDIQYQIKRLIPFAGLISSTDFMPKSPMTEKTPLKKSADKMFIDKTGLELAKNILNSISPMYATLLVDNKVTFTDVLVWAILVDRYDLAQAVWRQTTLPVHSALIACHLYKTLGDWFQGEEEYQERFSWFEAEALKVLAELDYEVAVDVLEWKWQELNDTDALELSELGDCKDFFSHAYVQRYLDDKFYSDEHGRIPPGTKMWRVMTLVLFPIMIASSGYYHAAVDTNNRAPTNFLNFYNLPIVKLISSTLSYIIFLGLLTANILLIDPNDKNYHIEWYEVLLWIWLFASLIEEVVQFWEDRKDYFTLLSNRMDAVMYALLVVYFILRMLALEFQRSGLQTAYTDVLVIATIACFLRVMNVFAFSKSLGPLFFVIIRLFNDVWQWLFIFLLFMISFQAGIFAFTRQAGDGNPWEVYPNGTMGSAFTAILGDLGDNTMNLMVQTRLGVIVILIYSLITQVMLVNLLIAMMGDTYSNVKENSDKEWKFYRYSLVIDYITSSAYPPPFNLVLGPITFIQARIRATTVKARLEAINIKGFNELELSRSLNGIERDRDVELHGSKTIVKMKLAKEKVLEQEASEELDTLRTVSSVVREHMRILNTQRDSDRLYLEHNMQTILSTLTTLQTQIDAIAKSTGVNLTPNNNTPPPPSPGAGPSSATTSQSARTTTSEISSPVPPSPSI